MERAEGDRWFASLTGNTWLPFSSATNFIKIKQLGGTH